MLAKRKLAAIIATAAAVMVSAPAFADGDAKKGAKVFKKCKACHVVDSDKNKVGPSLQGVMGRTAGTVEGFKYSKAMIAYGKEWNDETLAAFLKKPKKAVKGTKMAFAGLRKDDQIADVIAYIKENGGAE